MFNGAPVFNCCFGRVLARLVVDVEDGRMLDVCRLNLNIPGCKGLYGVRF